MSKTPLSKNNLYYAAAIILVVLVAVFMFGSKPATPNQNNVVIPATPSPTPQPTVTTCVNGEQTEFLCVGSISGTQTYYECVNGAWTSKSRYNYSECVKTFGPNETIGEEDFEVIPVANITATPVVQPVANANNTPGANATAAPSASPVANASASPHFPVFVNMTVKNIRTSSAEMYWFTDANATGELAYGDEPGVRRWRLSAQEPAFSQYKYLLLSPGKTYYFDVKVCANGSSTCVTSLEQNFSTPASDTYLYAGNTTYYPGDAVEYKAAQLNPK